MNKHLLAISSITLEQYNNYFKNLPVPYSVIITNQNKFLNIFSNDNEYIKTILKNLWKNNIQTINVIKDGDKITFSMNINLKNNVEKNFIKQVKEKIYLDNSSFIIKPTTFGITQIDISLSNLKELLDFKNLINDYFLLKRNSSNTPYDKINTDLFNSIINNYSRIPINIIDKILEDNKNEVLHISEHFRFNNNFVNPYNKNSYFIQKPLKENVTIDYIHNIDPIYRNIPFSNLTEDMKKIMCNRYFEIIFNDKLIKLEINILKETNIKTEFLYWQQNEINLKGYGITGNCRKFDAINNKHTIDIFSNSNLEYYKKDGDNISINEDLLGQIIITILHEYRHVQQQLAIRDENNNLPIIKAIRNFDNKDHDFYVENYKNDPAELDANYYSFSTLKNISNQYNINNPEKIILEYVKIRNQIIEDSYRIYESTFNSYEEVMIYLSNKLYNSISTYQQENIEIGTKKR